MRDLARKSFHGDAYRNHVIVDPQAFAGFFFVISAVFFPYRKPEPWHFAYRGLAPSR